MYRPFAYAVMCLAIAASVLVPSRAQAELNVVATVPDLAALARAIGGDQVKVSALSLETQDPHWVDAKPSLTLKVNQADLLLAVGAELEVGWLPKLQVGARNPKIQTGGDGYLDCAQIVPLLEQANGPIDRSMGDIHPTGNPHYLYDPRRAASCAQAIAERMATLDPERAATYRANLHRFIATLENQRKRWERQLAPYRGTPIITYHKSWVYLTDWLGLVEVEHLEPKPGIPPSPTHVMRVIRTARAQNVAILFQESFYPSKTGELVADKIGARLLALPGGTAFQRGQSYIEHMDELITQLEQALAESSAKAPL